MAGRLPVESQVTSTGGARLSGDAGQRPPRLRRQCRHQTSFRRSQSRRCRGSSHRFQRSLVIAGVGAGIAGLLIVTLFTREALNPIRSLTAGARRLGGGDLSYRVPSNRKDEVGELATTFNEMATTLERAEAHRRNMTADIAHELRTPTDEYPRLHRSDSRRRSRSRMLPRLKRCTNRPSTCRGSLKTSESCPLPTPARCAWIARMKTSQSSPGTLSTHSSPVRPIWGSRSDSTPQKSCPRQTSTARASGKWSPISSRTLSRTRPNGGTVTVSVRRSAPEAIELAVEDTGRGIPADVLAPRFRPVLSRRQIPQPLHRGRWYRPDNRSETRGGPRRHGASGKRARQRRQVRRNAAIRLRGRDPRSESVTYGCGGLAALRPRRGHRVSPVRRGRGWAAWRLGVVLGRVVYNLRLRSG